LPCESGAENPAKPVLTPHTSVPRLFTVSSVAADAKPAVTMLADAASRPAAITTFLMLLSPQ
jgi:hypothetical protein